MVPLPRRFRRRSDSSLLSLSDALAALGDDGLMWRQATEVKLTAVVGSAARRDDFDADFRLTNPELRTRWEGVVEALRTGTFPAPVELVQLGELFFVRDGHHRVSAARSLGWDSLPARVTRICTVAYAMCCLRGAHLASKAAERRFLERIPLPHEVRRDLWLSNPADWMRLADSAEAWAQRRRVHLGDDASATSGHDLACAWWQDEVTPVLDRMRSVGAEMGLRDVQLYVTALAVRDQLGTLEWPADLSARIAEGQACCAACSAGSLHAHR